MRVCRECGEEALAPYAAFLEEDYLVEHWVCMKCYNREEYYYNRETQEYEDAARKEHNSDG